VNLESIVNFKKRKASQHPAENVGCCLGFTALAVVSLPRSQAPFRWPYFHNLKPNGFAERLPVRFGALNTGRMQSHEDVHFSFPEIHVGIGQTKSSPHPGLRLRTANVTTSNLII